jgi:hypothetical protein
LTTEPPVLNTDNKNRRPRHLNLGGGLFFLHPADTMRPADTLRPADTFHPVDTMCPTDILRPADLPFAHVF